MTRTFTLLMASVFLFGLLTSATTDNKKNKFQAFSKYSLAGELNPNLKKLISYRIQNGASVQSYFANYVFSEFTTKSSQIEDSIPISKIEFEYFDNYSVQTVSSWKNSQWVDYAKQYTYKSANKSLYDSIIFQSYDSTLMSFIPIIKYTNTFDSNGNDTLNTGYNYVNESKSWVALNKTQKTFLDNNLVSQEVESFWNPETQQWTKTDKTIYAYDGTQLIYENHYSFYGTDWQLFRKEIHDRNEVKNYYSIIDSVYDYFTLGFNPATLEVYSGHDVTIDTAAFFNWNDTIKNWEPEELVAYNYNEKGEFVSRDLFYNTMHGTKSGNVLADYVKTESSVYYYQTKNTGTSELTVTSIKIFPNPATNEIQLQVPEPINCRLTVFNIDGKQMIAKNIDNTISKISIENFARGVYLFKIENNGHQTINKVIKN